MLEWSYYLLSVIMFILVWGVYSYFVLKNDKNNLRKIGYSVLFFFLWASYIVLLVFGNILHDLSMPPKFLIFIGLPFSFLFTLFYFTNKNNLDLKSIPPHITIGFQSFRIGVELILLHSYYKGVIPILATYEGLNFDILIGFSAPIIAFLLYKNLGKYRDIAKYWNLFGIFLILFVTLIFASCLYFPSFWGSDLPLVSLQFLCFPYFLVPGFLAPLAIFLHLVSLIQLKD